MTDLDNLLVTTLSKLEEFRPIAIKLGDAEGEIAKAKVELDAIGQKIAHAKNLYDQHPYHRVAAQHDQLLREVKELEKEIVERKQESHDLAMQCVARHDELRAMQEDINKVRQQLFGAEAA
jgi:predicted  nucleic acid-binding Zn-ribbon protein